MAKRQQNLRSLFAVTNTESSTLRATAAEFNGVGLSNKPTGKTQNSKSQAKAEKSKASKKSLDNDNDHSTCLSINQSNMNSDDNTWLSDLMKNVTSAQSIKDLKNICCELIAKITDLAKQIEVNKVTNDKVVSDNEELREDMGSLASHYDDEIRELKNDAIRDDEFVRKETFEKIQEKVDDLEGRSRRNNIRIRNLPEGAEFGYHGDPPMETVVESIIKQALDIDLETGSIQRAHRVGAKRVGRPRDIVAYFLRYKDKEIVRKAAPIRKPTYNNRKIFFNEDHSPYVMAKRKVLGEEMHRRRQQDQRAWLSRDRLMFIQDDFVFGMTAIAPYFHLTEPRRLFKAKRQTRRSHSDATSTPRAPVVPDRRPSSQASTAVSPMSVLDNSAYTASTISDTNSNDAASPSPITDEISQRPVIFRSAPVATTPAPRLSPAEINPRKQLTPPTPGENAEKHPRTVSQGQSLELDSPRTSASI